VISLIHASYVTSRELCSLRGVSRPVFKCEAKNLLRCKCESNNRNDVRKYSDIWFDPHTLDLHTYSTSKYLKFFVLTEQYFRDKSAAPSLLFFLSQSDISCFKLYRKCEYNYEQCIISTNKADIRYSSVLSTPVPRQHQHR